MSEHLKIDGLTVEVRRSVRRLSVDLTIDRGGGVVIAVPDHLSVAEIEKIVRGKQMWIYTALGRKEATQKGPPPKEFVSGEGFYYLGRKYRLKLVSDEAAANGSTGLVLKDDRFYLPLAKASKGRDLFVEWYCERAAEWIERRVRALKGRMAAEPKAIGIRDLGFRWGSCTHTGKILFHWRTILLPPERIDYLVMHELAHIHEHNHSPAFYERLRRASPDHKQHEDWFRRNGDLYSL
ncbi:MAG TPA: SprT family zinc-dependent metalloprotease [Verrucomicrobiota bacterium]|nr:SprT family zinc-dependent metalloprotease [Verrucomicrobiota bacterium]HNU51115.1 SprT family zinc-dependent metalloprotease [Verrucomicrobiota bacterium]